MSTNDKDPIDTPVGTPATEPQASSAARADSAGHERDILERLAFATLEEQRRARRWNNTIRVGWLVLFSLIAWTLFSSDLPKTDKTLPHTALVEVRGEIAAGTEAGADMVVAALRSAFEDDGAKGIVLLINSPGGSPVQAGIIHDEIRRLRARHDKPLHAVVEESCASAAYYIAAAADEIYVDKASIVGSIGVLMDGFGFTGLMDKLGVERRLMTAGENKGMLDPFAPQSAREREHAQALINQIHQQFISVVKEGRGSRLKATPDTFSGLFWNGEEAVRLGLADAVGSVDLVAREKVQAPDVVDYSPRENVAERLAKRFGASVGAGALYALRAMGGDARLGGGAAPTPVR